MAQITKIYSVKQITKGLKWSVDADKEGIRYQINSAKLDPKSLTLLLDIHLAFLLTQLIRQFKIFVDIPQNLSLPRDCSAGLNLRYSLLVKVKAEVCLNCGERYYASGVVDKLVNLNPNSISVF